MSIQQTINSDSNITFKIPNNDFETWTTPGSGAGSGTLPGWTAYSVNGGFLWRGLSPGYSGTYSANIRSNALGQTNSIGGCTSDLFYLANVKVTFWTYQPETTSSVAITFYLLDSGDNELMSQSITPASPLNTWVQKTIDVSAYINQYVKIRITQHTTLAGFGYATYLDLVEVSGIRSTITSDSKILIPEIQSSILSDAKIFIQYQQNILSDSKIKTLANQQNILSDALIALWATLNINNKFNSILQVISNINNKINSKFQSLSDITNFFNMCKAEIFNINNDFRLRALNIKNINNDVRFLKNYQLPGTVGFQSLGKTYIHVYFNGIEQNDIDVDSIEIHKILNGSHTASLDLSRAYDVNVPTVETTVTIYYNTHLLYKGFITEINPTESPEKINVICNDSYWKQNRNQSYFLVGHEPLENRPPNVVETFYATSKLALSDEFGFNVDVGDFVPQQINCFGVGESDAITSLIDQSGNFAWYYDVDDTKKIWKAGQGSIINIERQTLGQNVKLFDLLNHQFKKDATNIINRYRVQMGNITYSGSKQHSSYNYTSYSQFITPAWDTSILLISSNQDVSTWLNHSPSESSEYTDVLRKYHLPFLDPKLSQYTDVYPPHVNVYGLGGTFGFVGPLNLRFEKELTEGFTIDYENGVITFNDPMFLYQSDANGEITQIREPIIEVYLWKKQLYSYTDDSVANPLVFYTSKVGSYSTTITKELNLSDLNKSIGIIFKDYQGVLYQIPEYDDTNFANDYALWQLSKIKEEHITGNINITLDALCFYGIDLTKRIFISGITDSSMNILSIDIKLSDFIVSLNLENSQTYQRTVSLPWHGE